MTVKPNPTALPIDNSPPQVPLAPDRVTAARRRLLLATGGFVVFLILWQSGALVSLMYPLRLFVSLVHELGHGLTAILTGGKFLSFEVFADGSGLAYTAGGSSFLVPQMGYLGAALFGAVLLALTNRVRDVRPVAYGVAALVGLGVVLFTGKGGMVAALMIGAVVAWGIAAAVYRTRAVFQIIAIVGMMLAIAVAWGEVALRVGLIGAAVIALIGAFAPRPVSAMLLNFLALVVGLNVILDITYLLQAPGASVGPIPNDAAAMSRNVGLPIAFWALLWVGLALLMNGIAVYIAFIQPARRRRPSPPATR
jgi:hypothetical protein